MSGSDRILVLAVLLCPLPLTPQSGGPYEATPQRPTFTSDTSVTAPGTIELEMGATITDGAYSLPSTLKFTPDVSGGWLHQTEFSVSFDSLSAVSTDGRTVTQFGDRLSFALRRPVYQKASLSFAIAPYVSFLLRGGSDARIGTTGLMVYGFGRSAIAVNATWSGATNTSPSNPRHTYDFAFNLSHTLGETGALSRFAVFFGALNENASERPSEASLEQGISCRVRPNLVLDVAVREVALVSGPRDYQVLTGFTLNLGRPGEW